MIYGLPLISLGRSSSTLALTSAHFFDAAENGSCSIGPADGGDTSMRA